MIFWSLLPMVLDRVMLWRFGTVGLLCLVLVTHGVKAKSDFYLCLGSVIFVLLLLG